MPERLPTKFASAERSDINQILESKKIIEQQRLFLDALNAFPEIVMILDENRQIVYANKLLMEMMGVPIDKVLGKRMGEVFRCINADRQEYGCGTSEYCAECGALCSILKAQEGTSNKSECRLTVNTVEGNASLDLEVHSSPITFDARIFTLSTLVDISDEKRRQVLEQIFFHDVMNDAAVINFYLQNVRDGLVSQQEDVVSNIGRYVGYLVDYIQGQRDLFLAERGALELSFVEFLAFPLLKELCASYQNDKLGLMRKIVLECERTDWVIKTDKALYRRIVGNLLKNALEAAPEGGVVTVRYRQEGQRKITSVHNAGVMPEDVRRQIFQRSFTTKGKGRGIGTYGVKLFTERYLKGKAYFDSNAEAGTVFYVELL